MFVVLIRNETPRILKSVVKVTLSIWLTMKLLDIATFSFAISDAGENIRENELTFKSANLELLDIVRVAMFQKVAST